MDSNILKDLNASISLILAVLGVTGLLGAIIFFGFNLHRITKILPALLVVVFFAVAVPLTVNRLRQPVTYQSRANPDEVQLLRVKAERVSAERVKVSVSLTNQGRVLLKYRGPGRDFIIPITPEGGVQARVEHTFYIVKNDPTPGTVIFDVEGEDRLYNGMPLLIE